MFTSRIAAIALALGYTFAQPSASVQLFIHNMDPNAAWAASVQNACAGSTTYVISCTSAPMNNACSPQTATVTEGSDFYIVTTPAIYSETSATVMESCHLNTAESSASCVQTIIAAGYGNTISKTVSYNLTGTDYYHYDVQVTAGADHTANGGTCLTHVSAAASKFSGEDLQSIIIMGAALLAGVCGIMVL